jgi:hypothetical protein
VVAVAKSKPPLERTTPIRVDDLELDRKNPRFGGDDVPAGKKGEATIIKRLIEAADLMELVESIAVNGYLDLEPLFVVEEKGENVVVEGNRRVAAVKLLRDPALAETVGISLPVISKDSRKALESIHVIKLKNRDDARQLIGFKHINGTHKWDSYAKARFAAEWYRKEKKHGTTLEEIARSLGDRHDTVQRLVQGIFVLDQAKEKGLFEPENRFPGRVFFFSHLYTALTRPEFRAFLKLPERWRDTPPEESPVPKDAHPNLKELLNWLYGSKEDDEAPVIASQNPDLKHLGEVLANAAALKNLRVERNLKSAYAWSGARSRQFGEYLIKALTQAEKAASVVYAYEPDPTLQGSAENLAKVSRQLLAQMKTTEKDTAEKDTESPE